MRVVKKLMPYYEYHMTQAEIADALGDTRANIADIEKRAYAKIRKFLAERDIKASDLIEVRS
jgi:transcriptional regulator